MEKRFIFLLMLFFGSGIYLTVSAQNTDPYGDYSHLWEDPKAKAKEEKRKAKEAKKRAKDQKKQTAASQPAVIPQSADTLPEQQIPRDSVPEQQIPSDTIPEQSIPQDTIPDQPVPQDTIPEQQIPQDTIPEQEIPQDTVPEEPQPPADTVDTTPQEDEIIEPEEEEIEEEPVKEKKKREPIEQGPDFRAGLAAGTAGSAISGGFTYTTIGGEPYVGMVLSPELKLGKVGVGLDVPILYGLEDNKIRTEMFKDGVGALRLIRHVRYGAQKVDPVYVKFGTLINTMVGYGGLVNNYANSTSYEKRKFGLHYDINYKGYGGIEGMYSDFDPASLNLFVVRPYVRPIAFLGIPIVSTLEVGATVVQDKDQTSIPTSDTTSRSYTFTKPGIGAFGIDGGLTLLRIPFIQIDLFANYSTLNVSSRALQDSIDNVTPPTEPIKFKNGSGASVGLNFRFNFIADVMSTDIRIERLSYSEHYLPQFFDANYELNKDTKIFSLAYAGKQKGIYGSLSAQVLNKLIIGGSLLLPDKVSETSPAVINIRADMDRILDKFSLHANYNKGGLTDLGDAFKLDERSLAKVRFTYHMNRFLVAGVDYWWTFNRVSDGSFKATQFVSPYFGVSIQF